MKRFNSILLLCVLFVSATIVGCATSGGSDHPLMGTNPDGSPRWVNRGSGAFEGEYGKAFYGVGIVQGIQSESLAKQTAANRARAEIAKIFDVYVAAMMKDYQRSTTVGVGGVMQASAEEQDVVSAQKTITEVTLRGVQVRDYWVNPQSGSIYSLAILELNEIPKSINDAPQLSAGVRDHVRANADRAFDDMNRELQGRTSSPTPAPEPSVSIQTPAPEASAPEASAPAPQVTPAATPAIPVKSGEKPTIGLQISGREAKTIQTCFAQKLIERGYGILEGSSDAPYLFEATLKYKDGGNVGGAYMVKAFLDGRFTEAASGKPLAAINEMIEIGRPEQTVAVQSAVSRLCERIVPKVVDQITGALAPSTVYKNR